MIPWRGSVELLEKVSQGGDASGQDDGAPCPKVQRARVFHLCVKTIAALANLRSRSAEASPTVQPTRPASLTAAVQERAMSSDLLSPRPDVTCLRTADLALAAAAQTLQPAWEHVYDCCEIAEEGLAQETRRSAPGKSAGLEGRLLPFAAYMHSAYGIACEESPPQPAQYRYIAYMLDALVRLKQSLLQLKSARGSTPTADGEGMEVGLAPLVRSISIVQPLSEASCDAVSVKRRRHLIKDTLGIDLEADRNGSDGGERQQQLVPTLLRWRHTLQMLSAHHTERDADSFFNLMQPFYEKETRFRRVMHETVPRSGQGDKLLIKTHRGEKLCEEVFAQLAELRADAPLATVPAAPSLFGAEGGAGRSKPWLCKQLEDTKPWFVGVMGEGKGVIRALVAEFASALRDGTGPAEGMLVVAPVDRRSADESAEEDRPPNPWRRFVPAAVAPLPAPEPEPQPEPEPRAREADTESEDSEAETPRLAPAKVADRPEPVGPSASRLGQFRSLGNIAGLCLLHGGEEFGLRLPLYFCRHVYKYLIGRDVTFTDFAYFDPLEYDALCNLVKQAAQVLESSPELADSPMSEGLLEWEAHLEPGEAAGPERKPVTARNAQAYAQAKARYASPPQPSPVPCV